MNPVSVNSEKCIGCGLCLKDCPEHYFRLENGKAIAVGKDCLECGHCFAICPQEAIVMNDYDTSACEKVVSMQEFDSDKLLTAMKSRRTVRFFKDKEVEREKIDKIIEAGRCCQTARNGQGVHFTILGSKQAEIEKECVKTFRTGQKIGATFVKSIGDHNISDNFFFRDAPLVIVVSGVGLMNRGLATSYMELMAESLGLGVLISGFSEICMEVNPKVRKMIDLPIGHKIYHVMVIGYPDVKYQRTVPRKPANLKEL